MKTIRIGQSTPSRQLKRAAIAELRLSGIFDLSCDSLINRVATEAIRDKVGTLLLNMHGVGFMDSQGLRVLVCLLKKLKPHGIEVALCALSPQVKVLFEITSMDRLFDIYDSREALLPAKKEVPLA
ncbi:STAS domain-containing protein [Pseudanabaena sp. PCC 6802]|uniref:STAS domain-containing protein n=1 Tax=Pseudanabaena sp. PCC 6802 TaxID=118173 RepID=UPI00034650D8|nr:STAS domain-containing protein [Pseudanabaena sp. PCC 6802]